MSTSIIKTVLTTLTKEYPEYSWQGELRMFTLTGVTGVVGACACMLLLSFGLQNWVVRHPVRGIGRDVNREVACAAFYASKGVEKDTLGEILTEGELLTECVRSYH